MQLGQQIKKYRGQMGLSQDGLAERIYVSRQTVSNWENDKSYPDVNSLVLLSEVFSVSVDSLIKGDLETMKQHVESEEIREFEKLGNIFGIMFIIGIILPIPLARYLKFAGIAIWAVYMAITMYVAVKVEKMKKKFDIQTYKEILAFSRGETLDEISKAREEGKRPYQKILLACASGAIAFVIAMIFAFILK